MLKENGIKIQMVEGAELLKSNLEGRIPEISYKGVFAKSMLFDYMIDLGALDISKTKTRNVIGVTFSYGYDSLDSDEVVEKVKPIQKDNKEYTKNINNVEKEIDNIKNRINDIDEEITLFLDELEELKDIEYIKEISIHGVEEVDYIEGIKEILKEFELYNKEIKSIEDKINTRVVKVVELRRQAEDTINSLNYNLAINDYCLVKNNKELEILNIEDHIKKTDEVRKYLYKKGFKIDYYKWDEKYEKYTDEIEETIWYDFGFRSPSKSRVGDVIFFNREYRNIINKWQMMDIELEVDKDGNVKLVESEAYKSLTSSHIEGYIHIDPTSILVLNDLKCYSFEEDLIMIDTDENNNVVAEVKKGKDVNTLWDGMMLLDESCMGEYKNKGMVVLRHHFFKTCAGNTKLVKFLKEHYKDKYDTAYIVDKYGRNVKVSEIRAITTENSIKWEKLLSKDATSFEYWCDKVKETNNCMFGVCKTTHESKYTDGEKVLNRMSYQFVNSFADMSKEELKDLTKDAIDYIYKLKNDTKFFVKHLVRTKSKVNKNEMLAKLYEQNHSFENSHMFKDARKKEINKYKDTLRNGKLLVEGDNLTVFANTWTLLNYAVGVVPFNVTDEGEYFIDDNYRDKTLPVLLNEKGNGNNGYSSYAPLFEDQQEICAMRSPHNTPCAIMYYINTKHDLMKEYFNFDNNIIVVNLIKNSLPSKAMGFDLDSDFFFCTSDKTAIEASKRTQKYPTIVNKIEPSAKKYKLDMECLGEVDNLLSKSKQQIGKTSNNAQLALSYYHHIKELYRGTNIGKERIEKLLNNVAIGAIMAQISIDQSKKIFPINIEKQINRLNKELPSDKKPIFWQYTTSITDSDEIEKALRNKDKEAWKKLNEKQKKEAIKNKKVEIIDDLVDIDCPMNWIQKEIDKIKNANGSSPTPDSNFLVYHIDKTRSRQARREAEKVEKIVEEFDNITKYINAFENFDDEDVNQYYSYLYEEYLGKLKNININIYVFSLLISRSLDKENKYLKSNSYMKTRLLNILYNNNPKRFLACFKNTKILEEIYSMSEDCQ